MLPAAQPHSIPPATSLNNSRYTEEERVWGFGFVFSQLMGHASCIGDKNFIQQIFTPKMKELAPIYTPLLSCFDVLLNKLVVLLHKPLNLNHQREIQISVFSLFLETKVFPRSISTHPQTQRGLIFCHISEILLSTYSTTASHSGWSSVADTAQGSQASSSPRSSPAP